MITLVLGGTRSGKSAVAESMVATLAARTGDPVTYVATAQLDPDDADHAARIATHRHRRPPTWSTVECDGPGLAGVLARTDGIVLVDSLGTWVTAHPDLQPDVAGLVAALTSRSHPTLLVAEEVGLSTHAPTALGRRFVDALGTVNAAVSAVAGRALLVVAGRCIELPEPGPPPWGPSPC